MYHRHFYFTTLYSLRSTAGDVLERYLGRQNLTFTSWPNSYTRIEVNNLQHERHLQRNLVVYNQFYCAMDSYVYLYVLLNQSAFHLELLSIVLSISSSQLTASSVTQISFRQRYYNYVILSYKIWPISQILLVKPNCVPVQFSGE